MVWFFAVRPHEGAAEALQRAVDLGSKSPEVCTKLADLQLQQGHVKEAIDLYKQSIEIEPFYSQAYLNLARAYVMLKDVNNAHETLGRLLNVDPGNDTARQAWLQLAPSSDAHP